MQNRFGVPQTAAFVAILIGTYLPASARSTETSTREAEAWTVEQLNQGISANLARFSPDGKRRTIRGAFVTALLAGRAQRNGIPWQPPLGIAIQHARIVGRVFLSDSDVRQEVSFTDCHFDSPFTAERITFHEAAFFRNCRFADLDFAGAVFQGRLEANRSRFTGPVSFLEARFEKGAYFKEAAFSDPNAVVTFEECSSGGSLSFADGEIAGSLILAGSRVSSFLIMAGLTFPNSKSVLALDYVNVTRRLYLVDSNFAGTVFLREARIGSDLNLSRSSFGGGEALHMLRAVVGGVLALDECTATGECHLSCVDVNGGISAVGARFLCAGNSLDLGGAKASGPVVLDRCTVSGSANFSGMSLGSSMSAIDANFTSQTGRIVFDASTVSGHLCLRRARFAGGFTMRTKVGGSLYAESASFQGDKHIADFYGFAVKGDLNLSRSQFAGRVQFSQIDVGGSVFLTEARLLDPCSAAPFYNARIGGFVVVNDAEFLGPLSLWRADVGAGIRAKRASFMGKGRSIDLSESQVGSSLILDEVSAAGSIVARGATLKEAELRRLSLHGKSSCIDFSGSLVDGDILIADANVPGTLSLAGIRVGRALSLRSIKHADANGDVQPDCSIATRPVRPANSLIDLSHAHVTGVLRIDASQFSCPLNMLGATYDRLDSGDDAGSCSHLLALLRRTTYSEEVYAFAEKRLRDRGLRDQGNAVYIDMKRRERTELLGCAEAVVSAAFDGLCAYGREPSRILMWSAGFVLLGVCVFRLGAMEPRDPSPRSLRYNALWYSLDVFLPFVNLFLSDGWKPADGRRLASARAEKVVSGSGQRGRATGRGAWRRATR